MHNIINKAAYEGDTFRGQLDFCNGKSICENPLPPGNRAVAWENGWLAEMQGWLQIMAGVNNKAGDLISERVEAVRAEAAEREERAKGNGARRRR